MKNRRSLVVLFLVLSLTVLGTWVQAGASHEKGQLNLALIWHQHQPLYRDASTGSYKLPWVRVHAVQEYYDSPSITNQFEDLRVTYNLVPSLIQQIRDYGETTDAEAAKGGVYRYIGANDTHLRLALKPAEELTRAEKNKIREEFFWLNGYMLDNDSDDPYFSARYAELKEIAANRQLTEQEITDLSALFFLWQITPSLHEKYGLNDLHEKKHFDRNDIIEIIRVQKKICADLLDQYKEAQRQGSEIITSPYYHPILPLLMSDGWSGVKKEVWRKDTMTQLKTAKDLYKDVFGEAPSGLWPPEQAVSQNMVGPVVETGFDWFVSDEGVLADSIRSTPSVSELTESYKVTSKAGSAYIFFRQSDLSNKVSFSYGNKPTSWAVNDFMNELKQTRRKLENPEDKLLTVAMDGENWMFMAGYPNNGRSFLRELYRQLSEAAWVKTTTPGAFISNQKVEATEIEELATGSWAGDLSTWKGETEENRAWNWLVEAKNKVEEGSVNPQAKEAIYAAEGSDWFWWYGTDKDSGNDEVFDSLFKTHLINAYREAGAKEAEIPRKLYVKKLSPVSKSLGKVKVKLDGRTSSPDEWKGAAHFRASENKYFSGFDLGYGPNNLFVRVNTKVKAATLIGKDFSFNLYFSGGSDANVNTRYGGVPLGFGLSQVVSLHLEDVEKGGSWNVFLYKSDGEGGWKFASSIANLSRRKAKVGKIIEFKFPYETIGIKPEENFTFRMSLEKRKDAKQLATSPKRPVITKIPKPISGKRIFSVADQKGDDYGPGSYTYPKAPVFEHKGLFDLQKYEIYDSGEKWVFTFDFGAMTNPWSAPLGFSHQLINLYLDTEKGGQTETYKKGAHVRFDPENPWDYFIKIAGWPGYGREFVTKEGEKYKINVSSKVKERKVIVGLPKKLLPSVKGGHYLMIFSQDGYGKDHIRAVQEKASTWQGGGKKAPMVSSNVYDYLAPEGRQKEILSSYDQEKGTYPVLEPYEVG
ncbi:MAG: glucodextranase DOMON-like domain-containing protein [Candidatus Bipolaricaulia bacterium]